MEKDIKLGDVGAVSLVISGGKASISIQAQESAVGGAVQLQAQASAVVGADVLVGMLFDEIEKKSPAGVVPIEESVKAIVLAAVKAI